jgi:hypothetical protein
MKRLVLATLFVVSAVALPAGTATGTPPPSPTFLVAGPATTQVFCEARNVGTTDVTATITITLAPGGSQAGTFTIPPGGSSHWEWPY